MAYNRGQTGSKPRKFSISRYFGLVWLTFYPFNIYLGSLSFIDCPLGHFRRFLLNFEPSTSFIGLTIKFFSDKFLGNFQFLAYFGPLRLILGPLFIHFTLIFRWQCLDRARVEFVLKFQAHTSLHRLIIIDFLSKFSRICQFLPILAQFCSL